MPLWLTGSTPQLLGSAQRLSELAAGIRADGCAAAGTQGVLPVAPVLCGLLALALVGQAADGKLEAAAKRNAAGGGVGLCKMQGVAGASLDAGRACGALLRGVALAACINLHVAAQTF